MGDVRRVTGLLFLALFLAGCGKSGVSDESLEAPSRETVQSSDAFPQVLKVVGPRLCTGTLIAADKVLTASHCMREEFPRVVLHGGFVVRAVSFNVLGTGDRNDPNDVAVMHFDVSLANELGLEPLGLASPVPAGTGVTMLGYGCNMRGMGTNKILRFADYLEVPWSRPAPKAPIPKNPQAMLIRGPINRAETCPGDSGGPALVEQGGKVKVAGVLHGMLQRAGDLPLSVYSFVTEGPNRRFVDGELAVTSVKTGR